jgi:coproporphyrinogen III oxidase-like Fe-S oxidoreductase
MITSKSARMMRKAFEKATYRFEAIPERTFSSPFGIYIHVPFCKTLCAFCPFYKERFSPEKKDRYLQALHQEIRSTPMDGTATWLYFGGGTPNLLTIEELESIITCIPPAVRPRNAGIELLPSLASPDYLTHLKRIGFSKISMGIESLQEQTLRANGREPVGNDHVKQLLHRAHELDLWCNVDMMIGLRNQQPETFLQDIRDCAALSPSQVTIYPYMVLRNATAAPGMSNHEQFALIERAAELLSTAGYERKGVWTFGKGEDIYDSSRDELVCDYAGFGPTAFSTYGSWKVVNPEYDAYVDMYRAKKTVPKGFVGEKSKSTDDWRRFARMVYDLQCRRLPGVPVMINLFIAFLRIAGYARGQAMSHKGIMFAHEITKTVVESLPFPVQNPAVVTNYAEYSALKERAHATAADAETA